MELVVFDFDWSLIDQDCDYFVQEVLSPNIRRHMADIEDAGTIWLDAVSECLALLHQEGKARQDFEGALSIIPFVSLFRLG